MFSVDLWLCRHVVNANLPLEEVWISVLKLSTKWFCLNMRLLAIKTLSLVCAEEMWPSVKLVVLGRKYYIQNWVKSGYKDLVTRSAGISDEEATEIGLLVSLRIMRMRENPRLRACVIVQEIEKAFQDELASIKDMNMTFFRRQMHTPFTVLEKSS
jgi:hypothetical protein